MTYYVEGYFVKNLGDDLFLKVLLQESQNNTYEIEVSKQYFDFYDASFDIDVKKRGLVRSLASYVPYQFTRLFTNLIGFKYTGYILLGGSMFIEKNTSLIMLNRRMLNTRMSQHSFVIGANFGPYVTDEFLEWYSAFFKGFKRVSWRDLNSYELFNGEHLNQVVLPDVVLGMDVAEYDDTNLGYDLINIMNMDRFDEDVKRLYQRFIMNQVFASIQKKRSVHLVSINEAEGDDAAADFFKKEFFSENSYVTVIKYESLNAMISEFAHANQILATRFHAMILGWLFQKPTFVIAYSEKTTQFIESWNPEQAFQEIQKEFYGPARYVTIGNDLVTRLSRVAKQHFSDAFLNTIDGESEDD
ncbi:polysaccharide pyruvyl transferase family protein [Weissella confusa]|uniref:Polysaccharide pyruvyl transferase family protein n=1 Tax=Weissella confusa TaxID=1583 RepID=A0AAE2S8E3_WEICO|nr:polysaccharide pyruvyl transferase family protein [Weissella confusa]MBJ7633570.1 polysaccharide pyruvyl transferase family protein [Weissella confusa]MBJ7646345.1 polysaccharide pyruvyl transferase family protein [Weissella confusa]